MTIFQKPTNPHPRDGPWSWLVCFCAFSGNVLFFGVLLSFGVFLPVLSKEFKTSRGATAWVGSLAIGISFMCGPFTMKIVEKFGERKVGVLTGLTAAALLVGSSFAQHIELLYILYGVLVGFCGSCLISAISRGLQRYFKKRIALASGLTTSGASLGMLVFTPTLQALVELISWRGAMRVAAGAMVLLAFSFLSIDPYVEGEQHQEKKTNPQRKNCASFFDFWDCSIWRTPRYTVGTIMLFLICLGLYIPTVHMITFANDLNIPASKTSLLFIYVGACSTASRIVIGKVIDKGWLTALQCVQLSCLVIGLSLLLFTQAKVYFHLVLLIILYAIGNGIYVSTQYVFLLTCFKDMRRSYVGLSMAYTLVSIALISGSPIAGFVSDLFNSYIPAFYIFGGLTIFSGTLPFYFLHSCRGQEKNSVAETHSRLIGSRLANIESSLVLTAV